jgi:hypothetical protein
VATLEPGAVYRRESDGMTVTIVGRDPVGRIKYQNSVTGPGCLNARVLDRILAARFVAVSSQKPTLGRLVEEAADA